jgi:WD40 repeat protein
LEGHASYVFILQVLPDGTIVSGSRDNTIKIWKQDTEGRYTPTQTLKGHTGFFTLQVLPDGTIVSGSKDKTIKIWKQDAKGCYIPTPTQTLEGHNDYVYTLQVLPDGTIVSGSWDNTIKIWKP